MLDCSPVGLELMTPDLERMLYHNERSEVFHGSVHTLFVCMFVLVLGFLLCVQPFFLPSLLDISVNLAPAGSDVYILAIFKRKHSHVRVICLCTGCMHTHVRCCS